MTVSLWQRKHPQPELIDTGVVVIGAGISGLSAAIELESRGIGAVVLERAARVGAGASGRNAGYLMRGAAENYAVACEKLGRSVAADLWRLTESNLAGLREIGVDTLSGTRPLSSCLAATTVKEAEQLEISAQLLEEDGFKVLLADEGSDTLWGSGQVTRALVNPNDAVCSPSELVGLLHARLNSTPVINGSCVCGIHQDGGRLVVTAEGAVVRADRAIVCTNAYAESLLPEVGALVRPNRGQMFAFRPSDPRDAELNHAYYLNHGSEYVRPGPDSTVVFGGSRLEDESGEQTNQDGLNPVVQDRLERWARELITPDYEVLARWSGIMGFSPDGLPITGPVDAGWGADGRVWFCGGLTGHGMSMGYRTARDTVARMIDGGGSRFDVSRFDAKAG